MCCCAGGTMLDRRRRVRVWVHGTQAIGLLLMGATGSLFANFALAWPTVSEPNDGNGDGDGDDVNLLQG